MPAWKRWLCTILFMAGGSGFAAWGVHDLATWLRAIASGAPLIKTTSALLGIAPLGSGIAAIGAFFPITHVRSGLDERIAHRLLVTAFALMAAGVVLAALGGPIIGAVMRSRGYHVCAVDRGTRMSFTTWSAATPTAEEPTGLR